MDKLSGEQEILIREYEEAGRTCRWYEHLRRLNLFIFVALTSLIIGWIQYHTPSGENLPSSIGNIPLEAFGILIGITIWDGEKRISDYYKFYILRAKEIEEKLNMSLYCDGWKKIQKTTTFSLKLPFQLIPLFIVGYLSALIIYQIYKTGWFGGYRWLIIIPMIFLGIISIRKRRWVMIKYERLKEILRHISHIIFT